MTAQVDYTAVLDLVLRGHFTDCGGYYAPAVRSDGTVIFPSGKVTPDGQFNGAGRLLSQLQAELTRPAYGSAGWEAHPSDGEAYRQWVAYADRRSPTTTSEWQMGCGRAR